MVKRLKSKIIELTMEKSRIVYAITSYRTWCAVPFKFAGKWRWDSRCKEWVPLVYNYNDRDDTWEIKMITNTELSTVIGWTFNRERADAWVYTQKILEEVNYGKVFIKD